MKQNNQIQLPQPRHAHLLLLTLILLSAAHESLCQVGTKLWDYPPQGTTAYQLGSSPVIDSDGTIYAGYSFDPGVFPPALTGKLVALNPNGTAKWTFNSAGSISSPAIGSDGTIYFGTGLFLQNSRLTSRFYAVGREGAKKWQFDSQRDFGASAIAADGTIYAVDRENLIALNSDGSVKWKYTLGGLLGTYLSNRSPAIAADGTVYIDGNDARLLAINPDGSKKWEIPAGTSVDLSPPAIGADGTVYVGGTVATNGDYFGGQLRALNPNGTLRWEFVAGGAIQASPVVGRDGTIYATAWDGKLYAINSDGILKWTFATDGDLRSSPTIDADENIYFGASDAKLYALNSQGGKLWELKANFGTQVSSPTIGTNGVIYVGNPNGRLDAIQGAKGLSDAAWPQIQQNLRHTAQSSANPPAGSLPNITAGPQNQTVLSGVNVSFNVSATSSSPMTFQWRQDGQNLPGQTNLILSLTNVTLGNAGSYAVLVRNQAGVVSSASAELSVNPVLTNPTEPLALTGWNLDVIQENSGSASSYGFETLDILQLKDTAGSRWFEAGLEGHKDGLPSSRRITSAVNSKVIFELQPFSTNNVLKLFTTTTNHTATLTLTKPARYDTLHILAASATTGGGIGSLVLNFTDGTSSSSLPFMAQNWFEPSAKMAVTGLSALRLGVGPKEYFKRNDGASLHQTDIDLSLLGLNDKTLLSITFMKPSFRGFPYSTSIFAVSGTPQRPKLGIPKRLGNRSVELSVADVSGNGHVIETSTDLVIWSVLTNLLPSADVVRFVDPDSPSFQYRFYRCSA